MLDAREAHTLTRCGHEIEKLDRQIDEHIRTAANKGDFNVAVGYGHHNYDIKLIAEKIHGRLQEKGYRVSMDVKCENEYEPVGFGDHFKYKHIIAQNYTARFEISWI